MYVYVCMCICMYICIYACMYIIYTHTYIYSYIYIHVTTFEMPIIILCRWEWQKSCQNLWPLQAHLTGVIAHGCRSHYYFDFLQWPHDCNLTLFALMKTLEEINCCRTLPGKLMIQMDNCSRENKNKYVFGFLSLLVELNIFTEVCVTKCVINFVHVYLCILLRLK